MNEPRGDHLDAQLNDYLDGRLEDAAREAFERQMAQDPPLRAQVDLQEAITVSLRRQFHAGSAAPVLERLAQETPAAPLEHAPAVSRWQRLATAQLRPWQAAAALAAVLLLALGAGWLWWTGQAFPGVPGIGGNSRPARSGYGYAMAKQTPLAYYREQVAKGFEAQWPCPPALLEQITRQRFAVGLTYEPPTDAGVKLLGASYANVLSPQTVTMLARVDGRPVVLFIDRTQAVSAEALASAAGGDLHLHERAVAGLSLYELSPLDQPRLLPLFSAAPPDGGSGGEDDSLADLPLPACPLH